MDNMTIYNAVRECPADALKQISGGRLKGKSDINPMWRIKILTEQFGACGFGWYYDIIRQWTESGVNGEIAAFCNINLYVKVGDVWSKPIAGTGGSSFVANERGGQYTSDECYKMALTDAISVACKALGVAANVYWAQDRTKYDNVPKEQTKAPQKEIYKCVRCGKPFKDHKMADGTILTAKEIYEKSEQVNGLAICKNCKSKERSANNE